MSLDLPQPRLIPPWSVPGCVAISSWSVWWWLLRRCSIDCWWRRGLGCLRGCGPSCALASSWSATRQLCPGPQVSRVGSILYDDIPVAAGSVRLLVIHGWVCVAVALSTTFMTVLVSALPRSPGVVRRHGSMVVRWLSPWSYGLCGVPSSISCFILRCPSSDLSQRPCRRSVGVRRSSPRSSCASSWPSLP